VEHANDVAHRIRGWAQDDPTTSATEPCLVERADRVDYPNRDGRYELLIATDHGSRRFRVTVEPEAGIR
jgi:hypothetical protein